MASKMEVDSPKEGGAIGSTTTVKSTAPSSMIAVHPLAIVHMTDQHTRVTCGGSRYDVHSPVVGLLLGQWPDETPTATSTMSSSPPLPHATTVVLDADDIPLDMSEATRIQVSLHQAVFPRHAVVGWYRVVTEDDYDGDDAAEYQPTPDDVRITRDLQHYFQSQPNASHHDFLFSLLHVPGVGESNQSTKPAAAKPEQQPPTPQRGDNDNDVDDDDEQLPLNLFRLYQNSSLVGLEYNQDWKLETSEPERVAIERVIREKPTSISKGMATINEQGGDSTAAAVVVDSGFVSQAHSLKHSLEAMQQRIRIIMDYLQSISPPTPTTEIGTSTTPPPHPALLRHIHSLQLQLRLMSAARLEDQVTSDLDASLLSQLSTIAKAVCSIQSYTEKLQAIQEHRMSATPSASGGIGGGGGGGSGMGSSREDSRRRRH